MHGAGGGRGCCCRRRENPREDIKKPGDHPLGKINKNRLHHKIHSAIINNDLSICVFRIVSPIIITLLHYLLYQVDFGLSRVLFYCWVFTI